MTMDAEIIKAGPEDLADLKSAAIFEKFRDRIYRYIFRMVRDSAEAEDLTQETFLRAHRQLGSLQDPVALTAWLYRIATHVCYDRLRQPSYRRPPQSLDAALAESAAQTEAQWADGDAPRPDQAAEQAEMSACVQELYEELPDSYRASILLHDLRGLTGPEIAQMLGCSLETVKIRLHRARRTLQAALTDACEFSHDERGVFVCERKPLTADRWSRAFPAPVGVSFCSATSSIEVKTES
jgi:RNA polymerase sigma-70 factor (ECF subfamily)